MSAIDKNEEKKPISMLVIEDNPMDQLVITRFLKNQDYTYTMSSSVKEALKILEEKKFDVVLSDYDLGDGNAFDVLQFLIAESNESSKEMDFESDSSILLDQVFIIVTGAGDEEVAVKAMKHGASDYLIKDLDFSFLAFLDITVKKSLNRIKIEKEIREKNQILTGILNNIPIIVFRLDENLVFTEIIGSGLKKLDLEDNDELLINTKITNIFKNLSPATIKAISLTGTSAGHSTNFVGEIGNDNQQGIFEIYLFFDSEYSKGAIGFGIDITEKKQAEDKLNQVYLGVQNMFFELNNQMKNPKNQK